MKCSLDLLLCGFVGWSLASPFLKRCIQRLPREISSVDASRALLLHTRRYPLEPPCPGGRHTPSCPSALLFISGLSVPVWSSDPHPRRKPGFGGAPEDTTEATVCTTNSLWSSPSAQVMFNSKCVAWAQKQHHHLCPPPHTHPDPVWRDLTRRTGAWKINDYTSRVNTHHLFKKLRSSILLRLHHLQ